MKVLNLYAGIGGNRKLWGGGNRKLWGGIDVTAIEMNPDIAAIYQDFFPDDKVIVGDAHQYLLDHYKEYDFIWSSPPCQSHSSFRQNICVRYRNTEPIYPDMKLYQEILFLQHNCKTKWIVENVKPYYNILINPTVYLQRHLFWSNFYIVNKRFKSDSIRNSQIKDLQEKYGFNLEKYKLKNKRQVLRNCVEPYIGLHIYWCLLKQDELTDKYEQMRLV